MRIYTVSNISKKVVELGEAWRRMSYLISTLTGDKALSSRSEGEKEHLKIFFFTGPPFKEINMWLTYFQIINSYVQLFDFCL